MTTPLIELPAQPSDLPQAAGITAVLSAAENVVAAYMAAAYAKWLAAVAARVLAGFLRFGIAPDPAGVWATVPQWESLMDGLMDRLIQIARAGWINATQQLGLDLPFNPQDPILQDHLNRTRNLMVRTPDEVYRRILDVLGRSVAAGETVEDQVRAVRHVLDVTGTENWPARARTVAVTEVHRAWNFGALAASQRAQQLEGRTMLKTWSAREDSKTRPAHARADGQTVPVNQPFLVDFVPLMAPGDPAGPPDLVINCRCKPLFRRSR